MRLPEALRIAAIAALSVAASACAPIRPDVSNDTVNTCPAHPCDAYASDAGAATCNDAGACTVAEVPPGLLLVIGTPTQAYLAPDRTYVTTLGPSPLSFGPCPLQACSLTQCTLQQPAVDISQYAVNPSAVADVHWDLGTQEVLSLPAQATYRFLYGGDGGAGGAQDAFDLGLPIEPVAADIVDYPQVQGYRGPNNTPVGFQTYLPPGCYERRVQPLAPLSAVFGPQILRNAPLRTVQTILNFDHTSEESDPPGGGPHPVPIFDITRAEGLDGWTAYLREVRTARIFSNVAPLHGSLASGVVLATSRFLMTGGEALEGLELVLAPPPGTPLPTEVIAPGGIRQLPGREEYPSLPTPVTVTGRVRLATNTRDPVPANLVFTALSINDRTGKTFPPNFEFVARASATVETGSNDARYSVLLPQGTYAVAVRPTDVSAAVTVVTRIVGGQGNFMTEEDFYLPPPVPVTGQALVADGRPLTSAAVEVLPLACAGGVGADAGPSPWISLADSCAPRTVQGETDAEGRFLLMLDPGKHLFRIRPPGGSRLPWVVRTLTVSAEPVDAGQVVVPAPSRVAMQVVDSAGNPVANAVVRVYTDPLKTGSAVELGAAMTDSAGNYELFLAPPGP
jgi:hypothetical protein